jgi:hypothetical protein
MRVVYDERGLSKSETGAGSDAMYEENAHIVPPCRHK